METGILFYEMEPPYVYEDLEQHRFYIVAVEIRIHMYILRDHPLRYLINTLLFNLDMHYDFPLHWFHPDALFHPFHD
ncbi:hypothetical protein AHAS_Ahas06G0168500 [Arachis hypogaea]